MDEPSAPGMPVKDILGKGMPLWEKITWVLIVVYIVIVLVVF